MRELDVEQEMRHERWLVRGLLEPHRGVEIVRVPEFVIAANGRVKIETGIFEHHEVVERPINESRE